MTTDEQYMSRAIELATRARGYNAPNPKVGAVLVHQDRIIGEGYHQQYGGPHAEVNAVRSVAAADLGLLSESTLYVTLEPCFHYGKTPPCVQLVLEKGIRRVVVACQDPFPQVAGQSIALLRERGVEVVVGVLEQEARWVMRRFLTTVEQQRPHLILKWAQSRDGYIGQADRRVLISNPLSQYWTHQWRGEAAAILVGTNTAALDNPRLNNRLGLGGQPLRLVLDRQLRLSPELQLFSDGAPTWVFTQAEPPSTAPSAVRYVVVPPEADWWLWILAFLHREKIQSVLVEGGAAVLGQLLEAGLWDEAYVWEGATCLGRGIAAPSLPIGGQVYHRRVQDNILYQYIR